jgi:hypothetical protein
VRISDVFTITNMQSLLGDAEVTGDRRKQSPPRTIPKPRPAASRALRLAMSGLRLPGRTTHGGMTLMPASIAYLAELLRDDLDGSAVAIRA